MADITPVIRDTDAVTISPGSGVTITRSGAAGSYVYTIASSGGSLEVRANGTAKGTRPAIDFVDSASLAWTVTDDAGNNDVNISGTVIAGGAASDLATTGAAVNVSAASPPIAGQVLTATDATHATWQTPSGGGFRSQFLLMGA